MGGGGIIKHPTVLLGLGKKFPSDFLERYCPFVSKIIIHSIHHFIYYTASFYEPLVPQTTLSFEPSAQPQVCYITLQTESLVVKVVTRGSVLTKLGRRVQAFDSQTQKYSLWETFWAKYTQKYQVCIFGFSTFLY